MKTVIDIENLEKQFRKVKAVRGLSLRIPEGKVTAFLGPNGAGKTTTIQCALNLQTCDQGRINILGKDSQKIGPEELRQIGYVSENQELPLWMTVDQFLNYCRPMYPKWDRDFEKKLRMDFDLPRDTRLRDLSRGMRMKAALVSSLSYRPRLIILDEPFSGLDPLVRDEFIRGLLELTEEEGWSVFVSSHDIEEVERMADEVAIIHQGKLPLHESMESLVQRFRKIEVQVEMEIQLPNNLPSSWLDFQHSGRRVSFTDSAYESESLNQAIQGQFPDVENCHIHPMSLREIFIVLAKTYRLQSSDTYDHKSQSIVQ